MKDNRFSPVRSALKLLCTLLGVLLTVMLSGTLYLRTTAAQLGYPVPDITGNLPQPAQSTDAAPSNPVHILLIGQDRQEGGSGSRSDSIILCSFLPKEQQLVFTSFLRDLYVPIPGHGSNRLNAAYAFGGAPLLQKTMEDNFALQVDGCVEVDFGQFAQIVDLLGGVRIDLRADEAELICREVGGDLAEGSQLLNGDQALCYARIRKLDSDGDLSRTQRQRTLMQALLKGYKSASLPTLLKTLFKIMPMITTDMNTGELISHVMALFPHLTQSEIVSQSIPARGQYTDRTINGMAVLEADMEQLREYLNKTLTEKCS